MALPRLEFDPGVPRPGARSLRRRSRPEGARPKPAAGRVMKPQGRWRGVSPARSPRSPSRSRESPETKRTDYPVPARFRPDRRRVPGRYPLLEVFRGFEKTVPFRKYPGDDAKNRRLARATWVRVTEGPGWMYVAPPKTPPEVRAAGFRMIESPHDEIVVARSHLATSPVIDLYLDIVHEFLHILQRKQGRELWPGVKVAYVDRPTEIEAYAYSVAEARRLGVPDDYLRDYLRPEWVNLADYRRLLRYVGVPGPPNGAGAPR
jgi:hypothetical protein